MEVSKKQKVDKLFCQPLH